MAVIVAYLMSALAMAAGNPSPASQLVHTEAPSAPVQCSSQVVADGNYGETLVPGGQISLAPQICLGDWLYELSPLRRAEVKILDPKLRVYRLIGVAVLVTLHEGAHSFYETTDETFAECQGMARALPLLSAWPAAEWAVNQYDAGLPSEYHAHAC